VPREGLVSKLFIRVPGHTVDIPMPLIPVSFGPSPPVSLGPPPPVSLRPCPSTKPAVKYTLDQLKQFPPDASVIVFVRYREDAEYIHKRHMDDETDAEHHLVMGGDYDPDLSKKVRATSVAGRPYRIVATIDSGARGLDFPPASAILLLNNVHDLLDVIQLKSRGRCDGKSAGVLIWFVKKDEQALEVVAGWKKTEAHEMEMAKHARSAGPF